MYRKGNHDWLLIVLMALTSMSVAILVPMAAWFYGLVPALYIIVVVLVVVLLIAIDNWQER